MFTHRHLLGIEGLSQDDLLFLLETAETFREISEREVKKVPTLRGKTVVNLFYESSTRTRTSFEIAAKRLSADAVNISSSTSSATKGETLLDTARNLVAMRPSVIVIRHPSSGAPHLLARLVDCPVINAGDGTHEHPTQALLDAMTMRERKGQIGGLTVAIVGDILHSRVARSNIFLLTALGAKVRLVGPPTLLPPDFQRWGAEVHTNLRSGLAGADVVMALRLQHERQDRNFLPSVEGYARHFCITAAVLAEASPEVLVMHPGPMNRGIEIASDVADGAASVILDQVTNGVAVRMAILYLLTAQGKEMPEERHEPMREERLTKRRAVSR
ncbi:MAG: aspartate carbamoyltransferase catalytic subunit [Deltaproteobacteria bacterium]|nr:aspartate carbamoyltransferase catalytic subunit [Deltaproteobacteria bacterium]